MNLVEAMARAAERDPDAAAIRQGETALTYAGLERSSALAAAMLRARGIGPGDRVGLMLPNVLAFPVLYYGVLRLGAVVVPMNTQLKSREVAHYIGDSGAGLLFCPHEGAAEAESGAGARAEVIATRPGRSPRADLRPRVRARDRRPGSRA